MTPLSGLRILDLSQFLAGPYGTMLLADLGADVIKVEPPKGDAQRHAGRHSYNGRALHFIAVNRNKKSIVVDLKTEAGRDTLLQLAEKADVVFDNFRPGVMSRLGLDPAKLAERNPRIVTASVSAWGASGPWVGQAGYDMCIQGMAGVMSLTGWPGSPPTRAGLPIGDLSGGVFGALGILSALYQRERTGRGCHVETSLLEAQISMLMYFAIDALVAGDVARQVGAGHPSIVPFGAFEASDGWFIVAVVYGTDFWSKLCTLIGRPELEHDPRFAENRDRVQNRDALEAILKPIFRSRTRDQWLDGLVKADVPCAPVNRVDEVMNHPQVLARQMRVDVPDPVLGKVPAPGNPIKVSTMQQQPLAAAPALGEHTDALLRDWLQCDEATLARLRRQGAIG